MPLTALFSFNRFALKGLTLTSGFTFLVGCATQQQPLRDASEVSSADTVLIFGPSTSDATEEGIKITYARHLWALIVAVIPTKPSATN